MKLLFSEYKSDYSHYIFPYVIWGIPEHGETPAQFFEKGFLPSSRNLDRFYLCRQVRIHLAEFSSSSENRRILRKGDGFTYKLVPREQFDFSNERRDFCKRYADQKFGKDVMSFERLDSLMSSPIVSHLLVFNDKDGKEIGFVMLYIEGKNLVYYYYSFYDLDYFGRNLGMFMMTSAVIFFAEAKYEHLALGTCYKANALYKKQFKGAHFFNGFSWSSNLEELKHLLERDQGSVEQHLIESETFREDFYDGNLSEIIKRSGFSLPAN